MRTSKTQQAQTHRLIIQTAVDLMTQHGFDGCTMKQIARAADVGDATIYKYFPSKEKLVAAYFELAFDEAVAQWRDTPGQAEFTLQERLQLLVDSLLERLTADREFVALARSLVQRAPLLMLGDDLPGKAGLKAAVLEVLTQAEAKGEIAPCGFAPAVAALMADYCFGVIGYWLQDDSEDFGHTTQLVDLSLGVAALALQTGLINKLLDLGSFVLRSQLSRLMQRGAGPGGAASLLSLLGAAQRGMRHMADQHAASSPAKPSATAKTATATKASKANKTTKPASPAKKTSKAAKAAKDPGAA